MKGFLNSFQMIFLAYRAEIVLISLSFLIALVSFFLFMEGSKLQISDNASAIEQKTAELPEEHAKIIVDISGSVKKPGAYEVDSTSRLRDLLKIAGGLSMEADKDFFARNYNLARLLSDQEKIYIPSEEDLLNGTFQEVSRTLDYVQPASITSVGKISVNFATSEELDTLPSIGPATAEKIIKGRPYRSLSDLLERNIVSVSTFEQIKGLVVVD